MPQPYKGVRGEAVGYIPQLIDEGMTNTQIVNFLKENDLSYRTQYMYQDINRIRLEGIGAQWIKGLSPDRPVPDKYMRTWTGDTEHKYRVVIKYEFMDTNTGTTGTSGTTLYFDRPPTQAEVLEYFDVRRQTLENLYNNIQEVYGAYEVMYFRNVK